MKKLMTLLLTAVLMLSLCACGGNYGQVDLQDALPIPDDGIIAADIVAQIKGEDAIGVFTGTSGEFRYEWTIFGSDITEAREVNLQANICKNSAGEIEIALAQEEPFGFSALLSVYVSDLWDAQSATAYEGETAVASVSLTGSKGTILNLTTDGTLGTVTVRPDVVEELPATEVVAERDEDKKEDDKPAKNNKVDDYLSAVTESDNRVYSDGTATEKDQYLTDPVPEGKPMPVEPENQEKGKAITVTFSIECSTILNNLSQLDPDKLEMVPSGGTILAKTSVSCYEGESVFEVLQRVCRDNGIHMESSWTPIYNSAYIEGIHNLYEFDCGSLSGWMYRVNGWYPNYGCSRYVLADGDLVEWRYTCDLGYDVGGRNVF